MGFSVISLIEIIYFLSFRPYCANKRAERQRNSHFHGVMSNRKPLSLYPLSNDNFMHQQETSNKFYDEIEVKMGQELKKMKSKMRNAWMSLADIYKNENQAPYPYFD
jgi:hypothetical protein